MTDTDQATQDRPELSEQEQQNLERQQAHAKYLGSPVTDTWKIEQEDFRRLMRTGEFTPAEPEPEPEPEAAKAE